jgi:hypothetical protein
MLFGAMTVVALPALAQTALFGPATNYPTGPGPHSVAVGDFTGDAIPDLVTANLNGASVSLLRGTGGGVFAAPVNFPVGSLPAFVATADFNSDGSLDLAVANLSSGTVSILLGNGAGSFVTAATLVASNGPVAIGIADFNNDLRLDLAVGGSSNRDVYIFLGNGSGGFTPNGTAATGGMGSHAVAVGDLNGDGQPDLAVADFWILGTHPNVSIMLGTGSGTFVRHEVVTVGPQPYDVTIGDFNRDGIADLAVAGVRDGVSILLGTGTGSFGPFTTFAAGGGPNAVVSRDLNADTILDLAVANLNIPSTVSVLIGTGTGSFASPQQFAVGNRAESVVAADLNADGFPDLAVANENDNTVSILLNRVGEPPQGVLSVTRAGTGTGVVTSNPLGISCGVDCTESYDLGTSVTLTAMTASGSFFAGWSGPACFGTGPCSVAMTGDRTVTATFTATGFTFTDDQLTTGTVIKAVHVTELRQAINILRAQRQLPAFAFTESTLSPRVTLVRAAHILELRAALNDVYEVLGRAIPAYTDPDLTAGVTIIKRAHIVELRNAIRALE